MSSLLGTAPITQLLDSLPQKSMTTIILGALDFIVPGQWENNTNFNQMARDITREEREGRLEAICNHADQLYSQNQRGCQRAVWLFQAVDGTDRLLGAAALAHKAGEKVGFLHFLSQLTPKPDSIQALDLAMKLAVEGLAYLNIHGLHYRDIDQYSQSLTTNGNENAMRLAGLICLDGLIPLGPDFLDKVASSLDKTGPSEAEKHSLFQKMISLLPGNTTVERYAFIRDLFVRSRSGLEAFQTKTGVTRDAVLASLKSVVDVSDDKLDYLGAFLDASTSYCYHTGVQAVSRHLIGKSWERFQPK